MASPLRIRIDLDPRSRVAVETGAGLYHFSPFNLLRGTLTLVLRSAGQCSVRMSTATGAVKTEVSLSSRINWCRPQLMVVFPISKPRNLSLASDVAVEGRTDTAYNKLHSIVHDSHSVHFFQDYKNDTNVYTIPQHKLGLSSGRVGPQRPSYAPFCKLAKRAV